MRRNWQPINPSNFATNFAIFQPNLHLTAHSYLSAAGRLHMLANCGFDHPCLDVTTCSIQHLFNCCSIFVQMHLFSGYLINQIFVQLSTCSIDFLFNRFLFSWFFVQWFCSNDLCSMAFVQPSDHHIQ